MKKYYEVSVLDISSIDYETVESMLIPENDNPEKIGWALKYLWTKYSDILEESEEYCLSISVYFEEE